MKGGATTKGVSSCRILQGWDEEASLQSKIDLIIGNPYSNRHIIWRTMLACQESIKSLRNNQSDKFQETLLTQQIELFALSSQKDARMSRDRVFFDEI